MEYAEDSEERKDLSDEQKIQRRRDAKRYVEDTGLNLMISTFTADTSYIQDIITTYNKGEISAVNQLYKELVRSDAEQQKVDELIKQFGDNRAQQELKKQKYLKKIFQESQKKRDEIQVVPKFYPKQ